MKTLYRIGLLFICMTFLISCASNNNFLNQSQVNHNLVKETWMRQINLDPNKWTRSADSWYFTGEPNQTERFDNKAPYNSAMTISAVKVPQFTNVVINGTLQVQLVGMQEQNSVYVLGTNAAVRQTMVRVSGDSIYITQTKNGDASQADLQNIIVRIGVHNLRNLSISGSSKIEGRNLMSDGLTISSSSCGMTLLSGNMNLSRISHSGPGTISVIGAYSPNLNLTVNGAGSVNVSGRVNVHMINHAGNGSVSVIGANSTALTIYACGSGCTTVAGYANLRKLTAVDNTQVYLYWVNTKSAYITERGNARVGLAGSSYNLNVDITGTSRFEGQYLHACNAYVRTRNSSHANVESDGKIFAAASDNSSIYIFGSPNNVSRFMANAGTVLPVWNDDTSMPTQTTWTRGYK